MIGKGRKMIKWGGVFLGVVVFFSIAVYFFYPDVSDLKKRNPKVTAFMEYRMKEWDEKGKNVRIQKQWVPLSRVSPYLVKAVIIAEDDKFWSHEGFDFEAMQKAVEKNLAKKRFRVGGSTISQQLAKNLYLSPAKNPVRKIREAILTWRLERNLSKRRIIEIYVNVAEWGEGIFGIEAAARHHFGKSAAGLTAQEAARLAAVLPNPRRYSAAGDSRYVQNRADLIYRIMVKRGIVIPEYEELMTQPDEAIPEEEETPGEQVPEEGQHGVDEGEAAPLPEEEAGSDLPPPFSEPLPSGLMRGREMQS